MLLHRYSNIEFVLNLDFEVGSDLIRKACEETRNDKIFLQWAIQLPYMDKQSFVTFSDYKARITGENIDMRPADVILAELDEIEKQFEKGGQTDGNGDF